MINLFIVSLSFLPNLEFCSGFIINIVIFLRSTVLSSLRVSWKASLHSPLNLQIFVQICDFPEKSMVILKTVDFPHP